MNKVAITTMAMGLLAYLDTILVTLKEQIAMGEKADEAVKTACVMFLLLEDDIMDLAKKSVTTVDESIVVEFGEAARRILPAELVAELAKLPT
jgi:uncharacterized membrane protein YfbV (UPF0208 family)